MGIGGHTAVPLQCIHCLSSAITGGCHLIAKDVQEETIYTLCLHCTAKMLDCHITQIVANFYDETLMKLVVQCPLSNNVHPLQSCISNTNYLKLRSTIHHQHQISPLSATIHNYHSEMGHMGREDHILSSKTKIVQIICILN